MPDRVCKLYQVEGVADCPIAAQIARVAADGAVEKVFAKLGIDVNAQKDVKKFRRSLDFLEALMDTADKGRIAFVVSIVGVFAAFICTTFFSKN